MRLSGPIRRQYADPAAWIADVNAAGYRSAELPLDHHAAPAKVDEFLAAAAAADIVISEVGAWSNPIDPDPRKARVAIAYCQDRLKWADRIGAKCCVNIAGSRSATKWDGPHGDNFSAETFDRIVASVREIVDVAKPQSTFYTLETMPWIFPSGPDEYLALVKAIDRPQVAVHFDPVNMINTPARLFANGAFIAECFEKLGPLIKSCHAKDIVLRETLTVHLDESRPGTGALDYPAFLCGLAKLDADVPLCLEHLPDDQYAPAARYLAGLMTQLGL